MIGLILIILCLSIIFLTTPNARKKISKMYNGFIPKFNLAVNSYKAKCSRLFGVKKQLTSVNSSKAMPQFDLIAVEEDTKLEDVTFDELAINNESSSFESHVSANIPTPLGKTEPEKEADLVVVNVIETTEYGSNQFLEQNIPEQTEIYIAPVNTAARMPEQPTKEVVGLIVASLIADISRRSDSLNEELDASKDDRTTLKEEDHLVFEKEYIAPDLLDHIHLQPSFSLDQEDITDALKHQKDNILPAELIPVKPEDAYGLIVSNAEKQDTAHNYAEEYMQAHDITSKEDKDLIVEGHDGIIDIDQDHEIINVEDLSLGMSVKIPSWPHRYIYSVSDLEHASQEQKDFYKKFKHAFHQGRYIDTLGNSNYYFILLFDLFEDYKKHRDLTLLEKLIDKISIEYPRTRGYARRFLLDKMYEVANSAGIARLESKIVEGNSYMSWDWQSRYRDKLNLSKADQKIIERIYLPTNTFVENSFCATELVKLYIRTIKVLDKAYVSTGLQKDDEFGIVLDLIARKEYRYHLNSSNYNYHVKNASNTIYGYILKYCEQLLRSFYYFKKLSSFDRQYNHADVNKAIKEHILIHIENSLTELLAEVAPLDSSTERSLYTLHPTRWKSMLRLDEVFYLEMGKEEFLLHAETIIALNNNNSSLENIFMELSKFLAGLDNQKSLEYFLKYTDQNISGRKFIRKEMSKTMSKKLFKDSESHIRFLKIITSLLKREITIEEALLQIKGFYEPIRKKIRLDQNAIQKVQQDFTGTVDLLGEFLSDDNLEEIEVVSGMPPENATLMETKTESSDKYLIEVTTIESDLLDLFNINSFSLSKTEIADYCHSTGSMQNVLINNINEKCYDVIDDLLIEDNADSFTIDGNYYAQIKHI